MTKYIQSITAEKRGWGSAKYRRVRGLTKLEREAVRSGSHIVFFRFEPWHYSQSGYKVVTYKSDYDTREPTETELIELQNFLGGNENV